MTLRWFDGAELWRDNGYSARAYVTALGMNPVAGRVSPGVRAWSTGTTLVRTPSLGVQNNWVCGFGFKTSAQGAVMQINFLLGAAEQLRLEIFAGSGVNSWRLKRGSTTIDTSSTWALGQWHYFEFKFNAQGGTSGTYELRRNEVVIMSGSGVDLTDTGGDGVDVFGWEAVSGNAFDIDDIYMLDDTGLAPQNDYLGDVVMVEMQPNGDGHQTDFTRSAGSTNFENIDEEASSSVDWNESDTNNQEDYYTFTNLPSTGIGTIFAIKTSASLAMATAGSRTARYRYYNGSVEFDLGSDVAVSGVGLVELPEIIANNPDTLTTWTKTDLDGGEFGMQVIS